MDQLPIDDFLPAILKAVTPGSTVLIEAEPGAGKTTRVPAALLKNLSRDGGRVVVLEPRRLSARVSAERVAQEQGMVLGGVIGYKTRFQSRVSQATCLEFVTEGVFVRELMSNPTLSGVDVVVIDEFHERHLLTDLSFSALRLLQQTNRPDLCVILMSATLDRENLLAKLDQATSFVVPGRTFPVEVKYHPDIAHLRLEEGLPALINRMLAETNYSGHILVFLTGVYEIKRIEERLRGVKFSEDLRILPLYADVDDETERAVFAKSALRKVILSTNVAETSVTIPGVTGVIDFGYAKIAGHASWSGMDTLEVKRISQASAIQRAGRAGRDGAGICYRVFSEGDFNTRPKHTVPDIERLDLTAMLLESMMLRLSLGLEPAPFQKALPWLSLPDAANTETARATLTAIGALTKNGLLTALGERLTTYPMHPRFGAILDRGLQVGKESLALALVTLLEEGVPDVQGTGVYDCDVTQALKCKINREMMLAYQHLAQRLNIGSFPKPEVVNHLDVLDLLICGFPDRVAKRRVTSHKGEVFYNLCLGRGGKSEASRVSRDFEFLLIIDARDMPGAPGDRSVQWRKASGIPPEVVISVLTHAPGSYFNEVSLPVFDAESGRVDYFRRQVYGNLVLRETKLPITPEVLPSCSDELAKQLAQSWPKPFPNAGDLVCHHERIALLARFDVSKGLPRFEGDFLVLLQHDIAYGKRSYREILERTLQDYIDDQLSYDERTLLSTYTPLKVSLADGRKKDVHYVIGETPFVEGYIQDFYGISTSLSLLNGKMPLTLKLWAPSRRPVQVTSDLPGFWRSSYRVIRSELMREYPKHYWPDDPETAKPILHKARVVQVTEK